MSIKIVILNIVQGVIPIYFVFLYGFTSIKGHRDYFTEIQLARHLMRNFVQLLSKKQHLVKY